MSIDRERLARALGREHSLRLPHHEVTLDPNCATCRLLNDDRADAYEAAAPGVARDSLDEALDNLDATVAQLRAGPSRPLYYAYCIEIAVATIRAALSTPETPGAPES